MSDRLNWTLEEEDVMITILEGIVADGGRCDTSFFRSGTYEHVALKMREKIVNINITTKHVQNKMKRLKDKYSAAYDMLNTSGFGWDDTHKRVIVDSPEILDAYVKKHPNKNYTANRLFPRYERLVIVFGKDRATCSMAESATYALDHMGLEHEESDMAGFTQPLSTLSNVDSASSDPNLGETSKRKRKRNFSSTVADITKVFEKSMEKASADIAKLTEAITGGDAMTRLGVELEGASTGDCLVVREMLELYARATRYGYPGSYMVCDGFECIENGHNFHSPNPETMAILRGMTFATESGLLPIVVESNALEVVNLINSGNQIHVDIDLVVDDIRQTPTNISGGMVRLFSKW
ncbi:hypothetical protein Ddye_024126 [Dipteronia dyeriana]|uniref:Myb/SANT-like domain-containing protein n=1 Tax=Dipteronia dyeriana TaxID=168575 RepID=A0AAD9WTW6_9ROSI|nr:hypothetical protein Ddye_024126 [Dipteronia dyeriana]